MNNLKAFMKNEDGMGTVEVILITVVLIALVGIFSNNIKDIAENLMKKIKTNANAI